MERGTGGEVTLRLASLVAAALAALILIACGPGRPAGPVAPASTSPPSPAHLSDPPTTTPVAALPDRPTPTPDPRATRIGASTQGRPIVVYRFGAGALPVLLVGGIHGGYEWNTVLLAYRFVDLFSQQPEAVPPGFTIYVIPDANPDGVFVVTRREGRFTPDDISGDTSLGRLNANAVDLNRNWACNWKSTAEWGDQTVSAGRQPFSEPETRALRDFIQSIQPIAVVMWHSAAGGVFAGGCGRGSAFERGRVLAVLYAHASGYTRQRGGGEGVFTAYPITGDAANWISRQGIPALVVELQTHDRIEFDENRRGLDALLHALSAGSP